MNESRLDSARNPPQAFASASQSPAEEPHVVEESLVLLDFPEFQATSLFDTAVFRPQSDSQDSTTYTIENCSFSSLKLEGIDTEAPSCLLNGEIPLRGKRVSAGITYFCFDIGPKTADPVAGKDGTGESTVRQRWHTNSIKETASAEAYAGKLPSGSTEASVGSDTREPTSQVDSPLPVQPSNRTKPTEADLTISAKGKDEDTESNIKIETEESDNWLNYVIGGAKTREKRLSGATSAAESTSTIDLTKGGLVKCAKTVKREAAASSVGDGGHAWRERLKRRQRQLRADAPSEPVPTRQRRMADSGKRGMDETVQYKRQARRDVKRYLHEGWISKWTNFIGSWRPRYFMLEPGCLKYSLEKDGLVKESFILSQCTMRSCADDPVRLDIDVVGRGVVCLRTNTASEKQRWYVAFKKAQKILFQAYQKKVLTPSGVYSIEGLPANYKGGESPSHRDEKADSESSPPFRSIESSNGAAGHAGEESRQVTIEAEDTAPDGPGKSVDVSELFVKTRFGQEPQTSLNCMLSNTSTFDEITKKILAELREQLSGDPLKKVETLSMITHEYFISTQQLYLEEVRSRKDLEQSLFRVTRRNMKLEKLEQQQAANDADRKSRLANAQMLVSEKSHSVLSDGSDSSDSAYCGLMEDEFFECEDVVQRAYSNWSEAESGIAPEPADEPSRSEDSTGAISRLPSSLSDVGVSHSGRSSSVPEVAIRRRTRLPRPRTELKVSLWSILKDLIGKDLSRISMPVCLNEPTTTLQRDCEVFEYCQLLDTAAQLEDPVDRMAYVTLFSITPYGSTVGRTYKPFNPLLGETYEFTHRGFNFVGEQVSHHPPISAFHCSSEHFESYGSTQALVRLTGKAVEVSIIGPFVVKLLRGDTHEHYSLQRCYVVVHNIIIGKMWIETVGTAIIRNVTGGEFSVVQYLRKGWFDKEIHKVRALVFNRFGAPQHYLSGKWSDVVYMERVRARFHGRQKRLLLPDGRLDYDKSFYKTEEDAWDAFVHEIDWDKLDLVPGTRREIWRVNARPPRHEHYYGFGYITMELNDLTADYDPEQGASIPPTDSRFRPDLRAYESGDMDAAVRLKEALEVHQREEAKKRIDGERSYQPRWFRKLTDPETRKASWEFTGEYWRRKAAGDLAEGIPPLFHA
ncbi:oxysterol-binding protein [Babesia caballi]|uniref:Oxysterol-binding protein n=1 Tax=Babesia caballi TaxID=5871 RepID=A0AAV4LL50_BABCB|nr:oxysterol-binding protein [Babesia caballi]